MPRRPVPMNRPLAPTAQRRRPGSSASQEPAASSQVTPSPLLRGTAARQARAQSLAAVPSRPSGRVRPLSSPSTGAGSGVPASGTRRSVSVDPVLPASSRESTPTSARSAASVRFSPGAAHPLTDGVRNAALRAYDSRVKDAFDRIVPVLQRISALQHEEDFISRAQDLARRELGYILPLPVLEKAWVTQLDMRTLFAWCVFEAYEQTSISFFEDDPLGGRPGGEWGHEFDQFLLSCGFHLLDITPCADGRLAHAIAYALRIPFSSVRRRSHAGALFDVENTVNRWVKTEHRRYREALPNPAHEPTRYLKVVLYHFSSLDPAHEGCAAHGSDDAKAAGCGLQRLADFQTAVENSFCCGASVDLLLMGIDTDTDAIRVHVPGLDGSTNLQRWVDARELHEATRHLSPEDGRLQIASLVESAAASTPDPGMVRLICRLLENNLSQIDYVREVHGGHYSDAGHAERFIGLGIGFKEVHLRNLTYFAYMDTVEEGAADLDVGVKIFRGLNVSRGLPIPVVVRFDYHGNVPGARERAIRHGERVMAAIEGRYPDLFGEGLLHALLTIRDQDRHV
ncbi:MAG: carboxysome shell carbonic anhydrase, partial [Cyanobium sp.]